jgi:hypothetical protein
MTGQAPACDLCRYFFDEDACLPGTVISAAIGFICHECAQHTREAFDELAVVKGIHGMIPDHVRRNGRKKRRAKK